MNSWTERLQDIIHYATLAGDFEAVDEARAELADHLSGERVGTEDDCVCQAEGY